MNSKTATSSHEKWHTLHRSLVNTVLAAEGEAAGSIGDDLWEWMTSHLPVGRACRYCDWCVCDVAASVWGDDHPDGPYPARVQSDDEAKADRIAERIAQDLA